MEAETNNQDLCGFVLRLFIMFTSAAQQPNVSMIVLTFILCRSFVSALFQIQGEGDTEELQSANSLIIRPI